MDKLRDASRGTQIVLGGGILFLVFSFFNWFTVKHTSLGESMWHGIGVVAGLVLIALILWQLLRVANVEIQLGVSSSMITAGLAVLLLLFTFIRFIDKPGGGLADSIISRTVWAWLGLILAIAILAGAWMTMQAAGESLGDVRAKLQSMSSSSGGTSASATEQPSSAPSPSPDEPPADSPSAPTSS